MGDEKQHKENPRLVEVYSEANQPDKSHQNGNLLRQMHVKEK